MLGVMERAWGSEEGGADADTDAEEKEEEAVVHARTSPSVRT